MIKRYSILFICFFVINATYGQTKNEIDSLESILPQKRMLEKMQSYNIIANYYFNISLDKTIDYGYKVIDLYKNNQVNTFPNSFTKIIKYDVFLPIKTKKIVGKTYSLLGQAYFYQDKLEKSIEYFHKNLEIQIEINDDKEIANAYNNLGIIYRNIENYKQAIEYYNLSLKIKQKIGNKKGESSSLNNIGVLYEKGYNNIEKALKYYYKSYKIEIEIKNKEGISTSCINIGDAYRQLKEYNNAIIYLNKGIQISKEEKLTENLYLLYYSLYELNKDENDLTNALKYYELSVLYQDSLREEQNLEQINELEARFDSEKQQKEIELLNTASLLQNVELEKKQQFIKNQRIIIFLISLGFITIIIFSIILFKQNKIRKEKNIKLKGQNIEINQQKEEIKAQRDEIEAQRDFVAKNRDQIASQNLKIKDSIQYARKIQIALLPTEQALQKNFNEAFIFHKPKDIVSGDFQWIKETEKHIINVVADCTGHGVPGAFMSILGITLLTEITADSNISKASDILDTMKEKLKTQLKQKKLSFTSSKDGIDLSLCVINKENRQMQFSGAYNSVYIIRNKTDKQDFFELKADRMPIGIHLKEKDSFTNQVFQLEKGDIIYQFSDGYIDQFGGKESRKFLSANFKTLLLEISTLSLVEQKIRLTDSLEIWQGDLSQVDDILVVGYKI